MGNKREAGLVLALAISLFFSGAAWYKVCDLQRRVDSGSSSTMGANYAVGPRSLYTLTSGIDNLGIGWNSLDTVTTGDGNTALGRDAGILAGELSNTVTIGLGTKASRDNEFSVGSPGRERVVGNAANGVKDSDLATLGQVKALIAAQR